VILIKGIVGGVIGTILMWCIILTFHLWRLNAVARQQSITGLVAEAGGWGYLMQLPLVVILLTAAFGCGLYLTVRLGGSSPH
jgi:uncharacterized membrane protein YdjX (TVP38/TMEM64 family)